MSWYLKAKTQSAILQWLELMVTHGTMMKTKLPGTKYKHPDEFFLEHGRFFQSQQLTEEEMAIVRKVIGTGRQFKMKECYYNSQLIAQRSRAFEYVEGYCFSGAMIPVGHAWNTIGGKVIDVTLYHQNGGKPITGVFPQGWEYFGINFSVGEIRKMWIEHEMSYPIISWEMQWKHLQDNYPDKPEEQEKSNELVQKSTNPT